MGNFSLELPERCLQLLETLWPYAQNIRQVERLDLGPLTSTFLISMAIPIINLPIERLERREGGENRHHVDDRQINPRSVTAIVESFATTALEKPLSLWTAYGASHARESPFPNIANGVPERVAAELGTEKAAQNAADMPASRWCSILRNSLAHGGIAYLDARPQLPWTTS